MPPAREPTLAETARAYLARNGANYLIAGFFLFLIGIFIIVFICVPAIYGSKKNLQIICVILGVMVLLVSIFIMWAAFAKLRSAADMAPKPAITVEVPPSGAPMGMLPPPAQVPAGYVMTQRGPNGMKVDVLTDRRFEEVQVTADPKTGIVNVQQADRDNRGNGGYVYRGGGGYPSSTRTLAGNATVPRNVTSARTAGLVPHALTRHAV
jgi:energy-coupling factor transporter transmembrane protein EcfT